MGLLWARALCETWSHRTPDAHTVLIGMRYHPSFGQRTIHSPLQQILSYAPHIMVCMDVWSKAKQA